MNTVLYFYRWDARYLECAQMSGRIVVTYSVLEKEIASGSEDFLKLQREGVKIFAAIPSIGTGYHDQRMGKWIALLREMIAQKEDGITSAKKKGLKEDGKGEKFCSARGTEPKPKSIHSVKKKGFEGRFIPDGIYMGNQGQYEMLRGLPIEIFGDEGLNVFNRYALDFWRGLGLSGNVLSYELEAGDIKGLFFRKKMKVWKGKDRFFANENLKEKEVESEGIDRKKDGLEKDEPADNFFTETLIYGRIPVMVSEYCPIAGTMGIGRKHCQICKGKEQIVLRSERGEGYPVLADDQSCQTMILSGKPVDRRAVLEDFSAELFFSKRKFNDSFLYRICIYDEPVGEVMALLKEIQP